MTPGDDYKLRVGTTICPLCGKQLKGFMGLATHLISRHRALSKDEWGMHYPKCACGQIFNRTPDLAQHLAKVADGSGRLDSHFLLAALNLNTIEGGNE